MVCAGPGQDMTLTLQSQYLFAVNNTHTAHPSYHAIRNATDYTKTALMLVSCLAQK